mmetsp:Transcript_15397/g.36299  ORF Transcript_15397/g.36299 Transcript_15397/m.36299 type:complete len:220 (+) Transcript_15397:1933-2592(+)
MSRYRHRRAAADQRFCMLEVLLIKNGGRPRFLRARRPEAQPRREDAHSDQISPRASRVTTRLKRLRSRCLEASMKRAKEYELPMRSVKRCCSNRRTAWPRSSRRSLTRCLGRLQPLWLARAHFHPQATRPASLLCLSPRRRIGDQVRLVQQGTQASHRRGEAATKPTVRRRAHAPKPKEGVSILSQPLEMKAMPKAMPVQRSGLRRIFHQMRRPCFMWM